MPIDVAGVIFDDRVEWQAGVDAAEFMPGPQAAAAVLASEQHLSCFYAVPNTDVSFTVLVAELSSDASAEFLAGLRSSVFVESSVGNAVMFTRDQPTELDGIGIAYLLQEDVWVAVFGSMFVPGAMAGAQIVLANLLASSAFL